MMYAMLLQDTPPDTSGYMIAGYVIFTVIMAIYLLSLFLRSRNLQRDLDTLTTLESERHRSSPKPGGLRSAAAQPPRPAKSVRKVTRKR